MKNTIAIYSLVLLLFQLTNSRLPAAEPLANAQGQPGLASSEDWDPQKLYVKTHLYDVKIDPVPIYGTLMDAYENLYVLHKKKTYIEVFDKQGKRIKKINVKLPTSIEDHFYFHRDEAGRFFMVADFGSNDPGVICDPEGKELTRFKYMQDSLYLGFSNGVVFSKRNGKIIYQLSPSSKPLQPTYFTDYDETQDIELGRRLTAENRRDQRIRNLHLPAMVGKYLYSEVMEIGNDGSSYVRYETRPIPNPDDNLNPIIDYLVCVFDPTYHLKGMIPRWLPNVNTQTGEVYETEYNYKNKEMEDSIQPETISVFRWEKRP